MDSRLDENETELRVLVSSVLLHVLSDGDSLLDQVVQVLWEGWGEALGLEDSKDLGAGQRVDGSNTLGVTQTNTNLGRGEALLGELVDLVLDVVRCVQVLQPTWGRPHVWLGRLGDTVSRCMHTTHGESLCVEARQKEQSVEEERSEGTIVQLG